MDIKEIDRMAVKWIKEAGERIRSSINHKLDISTKKDANDLVTNVDRETEQFFVNNIRSCFPGHKILGEEGFGEDLQTVDGYIWVIDPIDGTMNFVHQRRNFMISVGIYKDGTGLAGYIYDVIRDELFSAIKGEGAFLNGEPLKSLVPTTLEKSIIGINASWVTENRHIDFQRLVPLVKKARGTRSLGSAAMEMAYVAAGWLDAYISLRLSPWDYAAGKIIVEELGGRATTLDGEPLSLLTGSTVFFSKPGLYEYIMENYLKGLKE